MQIQQLGKLLIFGFILLAQRIEAQDFWLPTSGPPGGQIRALAIDSAGGILAGTYGSGIFRSTDNGATWRALNVGQKNLNVQSLVVDPSGMIVAGTYWNGAVRSTDNGATWELPQPPIGSVVYGFTISKSGRIFAATNGGLFRSTNRGQTWNVSGTGLPSAQVFSIASDDQGVLYAGPLNEGLFKSTNDGATWSAVNIGSPIHTVNCLSVHSSGLVVAGTDMGLFTSTDEGITWRSPPFQPLQGGIVSVLVTSVRSIVAYSWWGGAYRSSDQGSSWTALSIGSSDFKLPSFAVVQSLVAGKSGVLFAGTSRGTIWRSTDDGQTWTAPSLVLASGYVEGVATIASGFAFAGLDLGGISRSSDHGKTWEQASSGITSPYVRSFSSGQSGNVFAGGGDGVFRSTDNGASWVRVSNGPPITTVTSTVVTPSGAIYAGTDAGGLYRSTDNGSTWVDVGSTLPKGPRFALAVNSSGHIFVGTWGNGVFKSTDNGASWEGIGPTDQGLGYGYIRNIEINTYGHIFAGTGWGVFRSADNGSTWQDVSIGISYREIWGLAVNSIGELFLGSHGDGLYHSTDNGDTWSLLNSGLTNLWIQSITVSPDGYVYVGTTGGVFRSVQSTAPKYLGESTTDPRTVLLLHMNETLGSAALDASNYANKVTATAAMMPNGRFGRAKKFSTGGSLLVPHSTSLNIGVSDFTLEIWVNTKTPENIWTMMSKWDGKKGFSWDIQNNGIPTFSVANDAGMTRKLTGKRYIDDLKWHHLAIRRLGTEIVQYVDGALDVSMDVTGGVEDFSSTASIVMGSGLGNVQNFSLDEVRISNVARSLQEFGLQLPPKNLSALVSGSGVNLGWTSGGGAVGALRYKIYRGIDSTLLVLRDSTGSLTYSDLGLAAATQYFYAVSAVDSTGFEGAKSGIASATTQVASGPTVATLSASSIGTTTATLSGSVNPNGVATSAWFEWGTDPAFASFAQSSAQSVGAGSSATTLSSNLTGLVQNTTYYFRTVAQNAGGVQKGGIANFTTTKAAIGPSLKAMHFSAQNEYVEIPRSDSLFPRQMTIELWLKSASSSGLLNSDQIVFDSRGVKDGLQGGYILMIGGRPSPIWLTTSFVSSTYESIGTPGMLAPDVWYHVAVTHDGTLCKLYVNGQLVVSKTFALSINSMSNLRIGQHNNTIAELFGFVGDMDEIRLWSYARSAIQIRENTNKLLFGDETGLVGYWTFDEDVGATVIDRSKSTNNGQRFGNAQLVDSDLSFAPSVRLATPANGAGTIPLLTTLTWNATQGVSRYRLEISKSSFFTSYLLRDSTITAKSRQIGPLQDSTTYYWRVIATGYSGEEVTSETWSFTTVPAYRSTMSINTSLGFAARNKAADYAPIEYRLFGLPGASDLAVNSVLTGTQNVDWQAYWDNGAASNYLIPCDGSSNFKFSTGRGFWVISMRPISVDRSVTAAPLNSDQEVIVPLRSGWNIVTNPFTSPIQWSKIQSVNGISAPIFGFDSSFKSSTTFNPYVGYYLFNGTPNPTLTGLRVPYNSIFTKMDQLARASSQGWRLKVDVTAGVEVIKGVEIGVEPDAKEGLDTYDERKPRGVGKTSEALLKREEWDKDYPAFASDIRPGINGVERWEVTVERGHNPRGRSQTVVIHVEGIESVPGRYEVYLLDEDGKRNQDLRNNPTYQFESEGEKREFVVIVGDPSLMRPEVEKNLPTEIRVGPNYPNPFNPETVIPIELPNTMRIKVVIYDILGRKIRSLYDGTLEKGRYFFRWDGKDEVGRQTCSGVYLYGLITSGKTQLVNRMLLMR